MRVTVSAKGQIVIPASIRRKLELDRGSRLEVRENLGKIEIVPLPKHPLVAMRGKFKGKTSLTDALLEERRLERERENGG